MKAAELLAALARASIPACVLCSTAMRVDPTMCPSLTRHQSGSTKYHAKQPTDCKRHQTFPSMVKMCNLLGLSSLISIFAMSGCLTQTSVRHLERVEGRIAPSKRFSARPLRSPVRADLPHPASQFEPAALMSASLWNTGVTSIIRSLKSVRKKSACSSMCAFPAMRTK